MADILDHAVASPCCLPKMGIEALFSVYANLGFTKYEVFTTWVKSAFNIDGDPQYYREIGERHGIAFTSFHLPPVTDDATSFDRAVTAARCARDIGAKTVLFKASDRPTYIGNASRFMDVIADTGLTTVLQNHAGSPISTLDDYAEVLDGINNSRTRCILEVGHFHAVDVSWQQGYELLGDRIALVHIKDQVGARSVPYGEGEIDLPGLFDHMNRVGYTGDYVVEMEIPDATDAETLSALKSALEYMGENT
jgi:sugar phosphate isomerase/epimerase